LAAGLVGVLAVPAFAQEGHPIKGTWLGEWGAQKTPVFVVLDWNGREITGAINPGPNAALIKTAILTPPPPAAAGGGGGRGGGAGGGARGGGAGAGGGGARGGAGGGAAGGAAPGAGGGGRGGGRGGAGGGAAAPPAGGRGFAPQGPAAAGAPEWLVHLEADGKDAKGAAVHYVIDGKIENVGLANRAIIGTWSENGQKGDLRMVRQ
jgi:hypothetical protein